MGLEWCIREPRVRFVGFEATGFGWRVGRGMGVFDDDLVKRDDGFGGMVDKVYRFMRSSVLPVARVTRGDMLDIGERARHLIADAWALKRNVSANGMLGGGGDAGVWSCEAVRSWWGIAAVKPCKTRS